MTRTLIADMPWGEIQRFYDSGRSTREVSKQFVMSGKTIAKARSLGLFRSRTVSDGLKVSNAASPRDYTESRKDRPALVNYRADCSFKFKWTDYPGEFDFTLVETFGWYAATNRGNNLAGVSRDHAVSVRYGFENNLPSEHLSHPANCVLMRHSDNVAKGKKNTMSYDNLLLKIAAWDSKYKKG